MGYYIETGGNHGKARAIASREATARLATYAEAESAIDDPKAGVIVVVDNLIFEAAGFAFSRREFEAFHGRGDNRTKEYVIMSRGAAETLSGFQP